MRKRTFEQPNHELVKRLREQFNFLVKSSKEYDLGDSSEAKRLAVAIRVMVHDTKNSKSLLSLLKEKEACGFCDTSIGDNKKNILPFSNLTVMQLHSSGIGRYVALWNADFESDLRIQRFGEWWHSIIIRDKSGNLFSRKDIVLSVANTDGGAHVDECLDEKYAGLSRQNSMGSECGNEHFMGPLANGPELPSIRQIAFEMELSLGEHFLAILGELD